MSSRKKHDSPPLEASDDNVTKKRTVSKQMTAAEEKRRQSNLKAQRNWRQRKEKYLKDLEETVVELESSHDTLLKETSVLKSLMRGLLKSPQMPPDVAQAIQKRLAKEKIDLDASNSNTLPRMTPAVVQNHGGNFVSTRSGTPTVAKPLAKPVRKNTPESGYGSSQSVDSPDSVNNLLQQIQPTFVPQLPLMNQGLNNQVLNPGLNNQVMNQNLQSVLNGLQQSALQQPVLNTQLPLFGFGRQDLPQSVSPGMRENSFSSSTSSYRDPIADLTGENYNPVGNTLVERGFDTTTLQLLSALLPQAQHDSRFWKNLGIDQVPYENVPVMHDSPTNTTISNNESLPQSNGDTLDVVSSPKEPYLGEFLTLDEFTNPETNAFEDGEDDQMPLDVALDAQQLGSMQIGEEYHNTVAQLRPLSVRLPAKMIRLLFQIDLDKVPCSLLKGKLRLMRIRFNDAWAKIRDDDLRGQPNDNVYKEVFAGEDVEQLCDLFQKPDWAATGKEHKECNPALMEEVNKDVIEALSAVKDIQDRQLTGPLQELALKNLERAVDRCPNSHTTHE